MVDYISIGLPQKQCCTRVVHPMRQPSRSTVRQCKGCAQPIFVKQLNCATVTGNVVHLANQATHALLTNHLLVMPLTNPTLQQCCATHPHAKSILQELLTARSVSTWLPAKPWCGLSITSLSGTSVQDFPTHTVPLTQVGRYSSINKTTQCYRHATVWHHNSGGKLVANLSFQWDCFSVALNVDTSPVAWLSGVVQLSKGWRKGVGTFLC